MNVMDNIWKTERTIIRNIDAKDIEDIQKVHDACKYVDEWADQENIPVDSIEEMYLKSLKTENNQNNIVIIQTILFNKDIIGFLKLNCFYPDEKSIWISILEIDPNYQKKGFGQEIIKTLFDRLRDLKLYKRIYLAVDIKNWPALRFWIQLGFNKINRMYGDNIYAIDKFASLVLYMDL
jgi:RimJ/RimL family protein N-acetyltransferase